MSMIKNCTVVVSNGTVVGIHSTEQSAQQQALDLMHEWVLHAAQLDFMYNLPELSDAGSEVPVPKLEVLSFNEWMQQESTLVF